MILFISLKSYEDSLKIRSNRQQGSLYIMIILLWELCIETIYKFIKDNAG